LGQSRYRMRLSILSLLIMLTLNIINVNNLTMVDLVIYNGKIITMDPDRRIIERGSVHINGTLIEKVCDSETDNNLHNARHTINAEGKLIFPGLINTHTHTFQALIRGLGQDLPVWDWFENIIDKVVGQLTPRDCYLAAKISAIEAIKSGTTCLLDYNYTHPLPLLSDEAIEAFRSVGIRGILARGVLDTGKIHSSIVHDTKFELDDCLRLLETYHGLDDGMIFIWLAPYTIFSTKRDTFIKLKAMADKYKTGVTMHAATPSTIEASFDIYQTGDLVFEDSIGFLSSNTLAVHCTTLTDTDIRLLKKNNVKISHNPASNAYLGEGIAPVKRLLDSGITVGLATDGSASNNNQDLLAILKLTAQLQKLDALDPTAISSQKVLEMATIGGAKCLGLDHIIGSIEVGKKADIIIVDPWKPNSIALHDPIANLVYSCTQENVQTVIVNGKIVMEDRVMTTVDEYTTLRDTQDCSDQLLIRSGINKND
jgi:5-methylthioadenosine/S-adenosylhomocysteine deaminase